MGGEGVNWVASSLFTGHRHVFQNLGEGTYYHSGSMAIRQAVAAKANITYKILFNDAVAMTGGQPVDGPISVHGIAHEVRAKGVARIALVSDDPDKFDARDFPAWRDLPSARRSRRRAARAARHSRRLGPDLRAGPAPPKSAAGASAASSPDPPKFAYINDLVCEGCGDCSVEFELPQRRAEGNAVRPQAPDQSVHLQQGFFLP